jgi:hypothetical protein
MTKRRTLRFRRTACGSRTWKGSLFVDAGESEAWRDGTLAVTPVEARSPPYFHPFQASDEHHCRDAAVWWRSMTDESQFRSASARTCGLAES